MLLQNRMDTYVALLRATAALFAVDGDVSEEELQTFLPQGKLELKRETADLREVLEHARETSFGPLPGPERPRLLLDLAAIRQVTETVQ